MFLGISYPILVFGKPEKNTLIVLISKKDIYCDICQDKIKEEI